MSNPILIAKNTSTDLFLLPALANRHGLIAGATGTGKTVTLQKMAESFSRIGVPVFLADVKGDLSGIGVPGEMTAGLEKRLKKLKVTDWQPEACTVTLWDVLGEGGHPVRATLSDMGPLLLARLLELNEIQSGVLQLIFKIADDDGLLLLDLKDLRAMVQFVGDNAAQFKTQYGNIAPASVGAIQRGLLALEMQGADRFFGEPMLQINDLFRCDDQGRGIINLLRAEQLYKQPKLYATFLLWLLSELFEHLPEVGDLDKPKLIFFFDEAHLLFNGMPAVLLERVESLVRLIRSKGVGVYFVTQSPLDIPDSVLGQLGNRVQHALRAFTPKEQKVIKAVAQTMRTNPELDAEQAITALGVGEALVSFLDQEGRPNLTERAMVIAPQSRMGSMDSSELNRLINQSPLWGKYEQMIDRESAFEQLQHLESSETQESQEKTEESGSDGTLLSEVREVLMGSTGPRGGRREGLLETTAKSMARQMGSQLGRQILRGLLGSILGGRKK